MIEETEKKKRKPYGPQILEGNQKLTQRNVIFKSLNFYKTPSKREIVVVNLEGYNEP